MFDFPVTARENWKLMLTHKKPYWMPMFSDTRLIMPNIVPDNIARGMIIESEQVPEESWGGKDMFGVEWVYVPSVGGSMEKPGVPPILEDAFDWKDKIRFPDIDSWDWEGCAKRNEEYINTDQFLYTWIFTGMFERLISFMGFENAAMALVDEEQAEDLHELLDALADNNIRLISHLKKYFNIDAVYFHDDWGSQRAPLFSLEACRSVLVPHFKKIIDFCHENDIFFELHSCGLNEILVPAMIEMGADCWCGQPINDKLMLREKYGDKLAIGIIMGPGEQSEVRKNIDGLLDRVKSDLVEKRLYIQDYPYSDEVRDYMLERSAEIYAAVK